MTMNEDLIDRLEARCVYGDARLLAWKKHDPLSAEAAAEIYHLRAENDRLRAALYDVIGCDHHNFCDGGPPKYVRIARAALAHEDDKRA